MNDNQEPGCDDFEEDRPARPEDAPFRVDLAGYEGPIDLLLDLAGRQKVDLRSISMLALAEQYLAFIQEAKSLRLEIAADYLVMAAWLAYMKSRLLLPQEDDEEEPTGAALAAVLRFQLQRLQAMQEAAEKLQALPRLGAAFFARGEPAEIPVERHVRYEASLYDLLKAYARNKVRARRHAAAHRADGPLLRGRRDPSPEEDAGPDARLALAGRLSALGPARRAAPSLGGGLHLRGDLGDGARGPVEDPPGSTFGPIFLRRADDEASNRP